MVCVCVGVRVCVHVRVCVSLCVYSSSVFLCLSESANAQLSYGIAIVKHSVPRTSHNETLTVPHSIT